MNNIRMGISYDKKVYVGEVDESGLMKKDQKDITDDFKRCVVSYCSEVIEFEIDGMKFKSTCERID